MRRNRKKLSILFLLALFVVGVAISGCSGEKIEQTPVETKKPEESKESESQQTQTSGGENPYDKANEISLSGDAKDVDSMMRPILNNIFGGAKPTGFISGSGQGGIGTSIVYVVKRPIKSEDIDALRKAIEGKGYTSQYGGIESGDFGLMFMKGQNEVMMIGGSLGEQEITVGYGKS